MDSAIPEGVAGYLEQVTIPARISSVTQSGWPVVISLWYFYQEGQLYCATQRAARIVKYLSREPRCAFEIASDQMPYCGVRGQGLAEIDAEQGKDVLERLLVRYVGDTQNPLAQDLLSRSETEVAIVIKPVNLFTWDFTERMQDVAPHSGPDSRLCPVSGVRLKLT